MKYVIVLEQTGSGFAVQVPDLAIATYGDGIETAKQSAVEAIRINLDAYHETGKPVPPPQPLTDHLYNPDFDGLLFAFVEVDSGQRKAA